MGSRGASSSIKSNELRVGLKNYFNKSSSVKNQVNDRAFKYGKQELVTDSHSFLLLNSSGLKIDKNEKILNAIKGYEKYMTNQGKYEDVSKYISKGEDRYIKIDAPNSLQNNFYIDSNRVKKLKTILRKNVTAKVEYNQIGQPMLVLKNNNGEKALLLPVARY